MTTPLRAWLRADLLTYLIVTAVSALVWYWAAGETRESRSLENVTLRFTVADMANWTIDPAVEAVTLTVEGSLRAVERAETIEELPLERRATVGEQIVDVREVLRTHPYIVDAGISIVSASPTSVKLSMDAIINETARVSPVLPAEGEIIIDPAQVTLSFPSKYQGAVLGNPIVEAYVDEDKIDRLTPDVAHTLESVVLRLPGKLATLPIRITPPQVRMTITVHSTALELVTPVRVQVAGPPEDSEYVIAFEPKQLRDVIVSADVDVIEQIETGDAVVIAIVHLKSTEKEARIDRKRVAGFVALMPDGSFVPVEATVGGETQHPEIGVTITLQGE